MDAEATVEVERRDGRDVVTHLRSDPPLTLRQTPEAVQVVASGAGPLGGDRLVVRVRVGAGARLVLRSIAAAMVLPGAVPAPSLSLLDAEVGAGASLDIALEPQIVVAGADHRAVTRIRLGERAMLRWRDEVVLGRHDEDGGTVVQEARITVADRPVLATAVVLGDRRRGAMGPAGVDGARAMGALVSIGGRDGLGESGPASPTMNTPDVPGARGAVMSLSHGAVLASVLGTAPGPVRRWLDSLAVPSPEPRDDRREVATEVL